MKFFKFKKTNVVSLINFTGIIAPKMGRKNGLNIQVPPFIESGDTVIIDTRTMEYIKKI